MRKGDKRRKVDPLLSSNSLINDFSYEQNKVLIDCLFSFHTSQVFWLHELPFFLLGFVCNALDNSHHSMVFSRLRQNLPIRTIQNQIQKTSLGLQYNLVFLANVGKLYQF